MEIHSIEIENWGPFADRREYRFGPGLNVVHGPNESGKSTLMQAISTALFTRATADSKWLRALRTGPGGIERTPRVRLVFTLNGTRYRVDKTMVKASGSTELTRFDGPDAIPTRTTGDRAQNQLYELLGTRRPASAIGKPEWRGRLNLCWVNQGAQGEPPADPETYCLAHAELEKSLERQVQTVVSSEGIERILNRLKEDYASTFTEQRGTERATSELALARRRREEAERECQALARRRAEADQYLSQLPALLQAAQERSVVYERAAQQSAEADHRLRRMRTLTEALRGVARDLSAKQLAYDLAQERLTERAGLRGQFADAQARLEAAQGLQDEAAATLGARKAEVEQLSETAAELEARETADRAELDRVRQLPAWCDALRRVAHLEQQRPAIEGAETERVRATEELQRAQSDGEDAASARRRCEEQATSAKAELDRLARYTPECMGRLRAAAQAARDEEQRAARTAPATGIGVILAVLVGGLAGGAVGYAAGGLIVPLAISCALVAGAIVAAIVGARGHGSPSARNASAAATEASLLRDMGVTNLAEAEDLARGWERAHAEVNRAETDLHAAVTNERTANETIRRLRAAIEVHAATGLDRYNADLRSARERRDALGGSIA